MRERLKEELHRNYEHGDQKKKSKKEIAKELEAKSEEAAKVKSIRSIYLSLAKMLHPDTVVDDEEKKIKEELMKKVTVAYNDKNLSELLKLEMQWVTVESKHIDNLPEEKLKLYISSLLEQVSDLEGELQLLSDDPKYAEVSEYIHFAEKTALNKIKTLSKGYESKTTAYEVAHRNLSRDQTKRTVLQYLKEFQEIINSEEIVDDYDDPYFFND